MRAELNSEPGSAGPFEDDSSDAERADKAPTPRSSPVSRVAAAIVALAVAVGGLVLIARAFNADHQSAVPATKVENGLLALRASETWVVNPDGSGLRRLN